jgi:hypothetical protein
VQGRWWGRGYEEAEEEGDGGSLFYIHDFFSYVVLSFI